MLIRRRSLLLGPLALLPGCASIGSVTVGRDRLNYGTALATSIKQQTLLNMVRLRYADVPTFVSVSQIVSGYTLEGSVTTGFNVLPDFRELSGDVALGGGLNYTDRPTITFTPVTGEQLAESYLTAIPPSDLFFLIQSGVPVDLVLRVGRRSRSTAFGTGAARSRARPWRRRAFYELIDRLREIQNAGALGLRVDQSSGRRRAFLTLLGEDMDASLRATILQVKKLLGLDRKRDEFEIVYGRVRSDDDTIAVLTRSVLEILNELSSLITVPIEDVAAGRTSATVVESDVADVSPLLTVRSGPSAPSTAYVAVRYNRLLVLDRRRGLPLEGGVQLRPAAACHRREEPRRPGAADHHPDRVRGARDVQSRPTPAAVAAARSSASSVASGRPRRKASSR